MRKQGRKQKMLGQGITTCDKLWILVVQAYDLFDAGQVLKP